MDDLAYKPILIAGMAILGIGAFFMSADRPRNGFLLFIATLALGFRTVGITTALRIHPAEVALVLTLLVSGMDSFAARARPPGPALPWWLWVLLPFMAVAWLMAEGNPFSWDQQLAECVSVAIAVPVFLATRSVLAKPENWRPVVLTFYAVGTAIALLGLLEYYVPAVKSVLGGFVSTTEGVVSEEGFIRAAFSFYGGPIAVFVCVQSLPLGLAIWQWWPQAASRLATVAATLLQMGAIYISGFRSQWLCLGVLLLLCAIRKRSLVLVGALTILGVAGSQYIPEHTKARLESLGKILEGKSEDTSGLKRSARIHETLQSTLENPLGGGWAAAGWAHSDFLQIARNLGWLPGIVFFLGYLHTLYKLAVRQRSPGLPDTLDALSFPLLLCFVVVGELLAFQGCEVHVFMILPVWLLWAMAHTWLSQTMPVSEPGRDHEIGKKAAPAPRCVTAGLWGRRRD